MVSKEYKSQDRPSEVSEQTEQEIHALLSLDDHSLKYDVSCLIAKGQSSLVRHSRHTHDVEEEERVSLPELTCTDVRSDVDEGEEELRHLSINLIPVSENLITMHGDTHHSLIPEFLERLLCWFICTRKTPLWRWRSGDTGRRTCAIHCRWSQDSG